jgi:Ni/Co efflux regulator RcnB
MNVLVRLVLLSATALALTTPAMGEAQTAMKPPPKGGLIPSGPSSMAPRGPNGEVVSGPGGSAVRGPNSGEIGRRPSAATTAGASSRGGGVERRAYGAPTGRAFYYGGRAHYGVYAPAFAYPPGWSYRRWAVGTVLPAVFLTRPYDYADYAALGLPHPAAGHRWVRYGPDLLMADTRTGAIIHAAHGVFVER